MGISAKHALNQMNTMNVSMEKPPSKRQRTAPSVAVASTPRSEKRQDDVLTISLKATPPEGFRLNGPEPLPANTKTIQVVDIKQTRHEILANWRGFSPAEIVRLHKIHYNLRSASVMLSNLKKELAALEDPPNEEYLSKLALSKAEYNSIRKLNQDTRKRGALNVLTVSNADAIVLQSLQYITTSDANLLFAALLVLTGARPIEIAKIAQYKTALNNEQQHPAFWACQFKFAKRGTMLTKYNECRDRPFLAPYWLIERGLAIVRKRWPCRGLTNHHISKKFSSQWQKIVVKAYPMLPGITARLCRRFFAVYSFAFFGKSVFVGGESQASLNGYASWVLGHASLEDQVIAYSSLIIRPVPKLKLFEIGRNLKVSENSGSAKPSLKSERTHA